MQRVFGQEFIESSRYRTNSHSQGCSAGVSTPGGGKGQCDPEQSASRRGIMGFYF